MLRRVLPEDLLGRVITLTQHSPRPIVDDRVLAPLQMSPEQAGCKRVIDQARHCRRRSVVDSFDASDSFLSTLSWVQVIDAAYVDPVIQLFNQLKPNDKPAVYCESQVLNGLSQLCSSEQKSLIECATSDGGVALKFGLEPSANGRSKLTTRQELPCAAIFTVSYSARLFRPTRLSRFYSDSLYRT